MTNHDADKPNGYDAKGHKTFCPLIGGECMRDVCALYQSWRDGEYAGCSIYYLGRAALPTR